MRYQVYFPLWLGFEVEDPSAEMPERKTKKALQELVTDEVWGAIHGPLECLQDELDVLEDVVPQIESPPNVSISFFDAGVSAGYEVEIPREDSRDAGEAA